MAILFTTLLLGAISYNQVYGSSLCQYYENITSTHTACLSLNGNAVSETEKQAILDFHNRVRGEVSPAATNMLKMTWDDNLADLAQRWVGTCPNGHDSNFDRYLFGYYTVGQNWAGGSGTTWNSIMTLWEDEKDDWSYATHPAPNTGHYTQMIWASSNKIGCAMATSCSGASPNQYVCNYGPAGNTYGEKPYTSGTAASACGTASGNLCDCGEKMCRNYATLNVGTCNCDCYSYNSAFTEGDDCRMNCGNAFDYGVCGTGSFVYSNCKVYSNMPVGFCPLLCKVCPAITDLP